MSLPWGIKVVLGLASDSFPIYGRRRGPYLLLGWLTFVKCNLLMALLGDPPVQLLVLLLFAMTLGLAQADVSTDALVVERSAVFGPQLQALGYSLRFLGGIAGGKCAVLCRVLLHSYSISVHTSTA
jgi:MFS family permease